MTPYPLARRSVLDLEGFARHVGMHPDLVRRLVALDLLPAWHDPGGGMWFAPEHAAVVARIRRLRAGLPLGYAAVGVVLGLLERIERLEAAARSSS